LLKKRFIFDYVIAGLGNLGNKYEKSRHNIGFLVIDYMVDKHQLQPFSKKLDSLITEGTFFEKKILFVKPQTMMNISGQSLKSVLNYYDIKPNKLIVIYDTINQPFGYLKLRYKGSPPAHNGIKSIVDNLSTRDFFQLRFGIDKPIEEDLIKYVLSNWSNKEKSELNQCISFFDECLLHLFQYGEKSAMKNYNNKSYDLK